MIAAGLAVQIKMKQPEISAAAPGAPAAAGA
jgi:hypothetical protein